jgi:hypothetical protein
MSYGETYVTPHQLNPMVSGATRTDRKIELDLILHTEFIIFAQQLPAWYVQVVNSGTR